MTQDPLVFPVPLETQGRAARVEQLWQHFFLDPSQWLDKRLHKKFPEAPDFEHMATGTSLRVNDKFSPLWLKAKLATLTPQQSSSLSTGLINAASKSIYLEQLWQDFFEDPSQWWDSRLIKKSRMYPDFKHKNTDEGLWIESWLNPPWVKAKVGIITSNTLQSSNGVGLWVRDSCGKGGSHVSKLLKEGRSKDALHIMVLMVHQNIQAPVSDFIGLLKECTRWKGLTEGRQVHALIVQSGLSSNVILGNRLIDMYAKCGSLLDSRKIFDAMLDRNVFSWTAIMSAYVDLGQAKEAIVLYHQMQHLGITPDKVTFVVALKACAKVSALELGKQIHSLVISRDLESDNIMENVLLDFYAKCGCMEDACQVFNKMTEHDVFSWTAMMGGYVRQGLGMEALALYEQMKYEHVEPDIVTYVVLVNACADISALEEGRELHSCIIKSGFESDMIVANTLVDMYAKCGSIEHARKVFDKMHDRNVISWNSIIQGYVNMGLGEEALFLYKEMKQADIRPNNVTYVLLLHACAITAALKEGKQLHLQIIRDGYDSNVEVASALVDMYAKSRSIKCARRIFDNMQERNVVSWNAMISGYVQQGLGKEALILDERMNREGVLPNHITYVLLLNACASMGALRQGLELHEKIIKSGFESIVMVGNNLINLYAKCGSIDQAYQFFSSMPERNVVSWNAMLTGYTQLGLLEKAFALYDEMRQGTVQPNHVTYVILLNACANMGAIEQGKQLHQHIIGSSLEADVSVGNTLVDMYAKCRSIERARGVFDAMHERNIVSWNTMIAGYVYQGLGKEALAMYEQMRDEGLQLGIVTFVVLLNASASIAALEQGKQLHSHIIRMGVDSDLILGNSLIDMYAKCGSIKHARRVFESMHELNVVSWNALIAGYAQQGLGEEALTLFTHMQRTGMEPNEVTYASVLSACSHSGLVDEGREVFDSICSDHGAAPNMDHYACMVDLLCRTGRVADAEEFINEMPVRPDAVIWLTLLAGARRHGHMDIGRRAFDCVVKLEPKHSAPYVLLSDIYAAEGFRQKI